jgi:hypothetical protein
VAELDKARDGEQHTDETRAGHGDPFAREQQGRGSERGQHVDAILQQRREASTTSAMPMRTLRSGMLCTKAVSTTATREHGRADPDHLGREQVRVEPGRRRQQPAERSVGEHLLRAGLQCLAPAVREQRVPRAVERVENGTRDRQHQQASHSTAT